MFHFFKKRIHESVALSVYLASALTLQVAWIANWLVYRSEWVRNLMSINASIGPISGLYLKTFCVFVLVFGLSVLFFRGKDVSHWRERVVWLFFVSVVMFLVLTYPSVYEFVITSDRQTL